MFGGGQSEGWCFTINIDNFVFIFLGWVIRKWFNKFVLISVCGIFLLKEALQLIFRLLVIIFLHVDRVLQYFRVIHGTPADQWTVISKGWKLVFFDVAMNSLLNIEVLAHTLYITANKIIINLVQSKMNHYQYLFTSRLITLDLTKATDKKGDICLTFILTKLIPENLIKLFINYVRYKSIRDHAYTSFAASDISWDPCCE